MGERLYTEHPELYDVIQSGYEYDRDVAVIETVLAERGLDQCRLLEIGCGTGEHTRRLVEAGFAVTAVDKHASMLEVAATKCDASFSVDALPNLSIEGGYDAIIAVRGVINHVHPDELDLALDAMVERLTDRGVILFDNARLPAEGNELMLDVGTSEDGDYARLAQHVATESDTLEWRSVFLGADGTFFANKRPMSPFRDGTIADALSERGLAVFMRDGFGPNDRRTVFVADR